MTIGVLEKAAFFSELYLKKHKLLPRKRNLFLLFFYYKFPDSAPKSLSDFEASTLARLCQA
jgi:hypothetical protein